MADAEMAARLEQRQHARDDFALGFVVEVDQHVAQEHHVEAAEFGQPVVQVGMREAHLLPQPAFDQHRALVLALALQAVAVQEGQGDLARALQRVVAGAGLGQHPAADVGAHHLEGPLAQAIGQDHRHAVGLLAAGAGRAPDAERRRTGVRAGHGAQQVEVLGLAEEVGFVGGQQVDRRLNLRRVRLALQQGEVIAVAAQPPCLKALGQAATDQGFLGRGQGDAGGIEDESLEVAEFMVGQRRIG